MPIKPFGQYIAQPIDQSSGFKISSSNSTVPVTVEIIDFVRPLWEKEPNFKPDDLNLDESDLEPFAAFEKQ